MSLLVLYQCTHSLVIFSTSVTVSSGGPRRTLGVPTRPHGAATQPRPQQVPSGLPGTMAGAVHTRPQGGGRLPGSMRTIIPVQHATSSRHGRASSLVTALQRAAESQEAAHIVFPAQRPYLRMQSRSFQDAITTQVVYPAPVREADFGSPCTRPPSLGCRHICSCSTLLSRDVAGSADGSRDARRDQPAAPRGLDPAQLVR
jgi:hypothetical protein